MEEWEVNSDINAALKDWNYDFIDNNHFVYPNGRIVDISKYSRELEILKSRLYNKVYYDPTTWAEFNYRDKNNIK